MILNPENIFLLFGDENLPTIKFTLKAVRAGLADEYIQTCYERSPLRKERLWVEVDNRDMAFEQRFAIYRQIECYKALHVNPDLNEELLPQNKELLDEMLKVYADIICHHLENFGFVNPKFDLNATHPENGRLFSRIISVQKPMEATK